MEYDVRDPFAYSEDPQAVNEAALAELAKTKREYNKHIARAAVAAKADAEKPPVKKWGYTIDDNDPIDGYSEDPETIQKFTSKEVDNSEDYYIPEAPKFYRKPKIGETEEPLPIEGSEPRLMEPDRTRLNETFKKCEEIRNLYKKPGNVRYRLLSVSSVEMEQVAQPDEPGERVKLNCDEIEKAVKIANGGEKMDEYAQDTLAAAQLYLGGILIGDDADSVSIGITETIVSPNGQIGKKPDTYKNLVVVRWIKSGANHVVAFSPRENARIYALVDDSMGDSWRKKFLMAGAVDGEERRDISLMNHEDREDKYHHEKTFEKATGVILNKEADIFKESDIFQDKASIAESLGRQCQKLAHLDRAKLQKMLGKSSREESGKKEKMEDEASINDKKKNG